MRLPVRLARRTSRVRSGRKSAVEALLGWWVKRNCRVGKRIAPHTATRTLRPGVGIQRRVRRRRHMEETTGNNSNRVASAYHSSKSASGQHAVLWSRRRRRAARSFLLRVSQVPGGALGAAPHEAVTQQQLADPGRAEPHLRALLQVRCQPCTCPAGERKAQLPRLLLYRLHQQLEIGRCDARGPAGVRRGSQSFQATKTPTAAAVVDRPRRHAQRLSDAAGALSLGTPQNDGSAQGLPPPSLAHCALELAPLGWCQFDAAKIQAPCYFRYPPPRTLRCHPLNGFTLPGLAAPVLRHVRTFKRLCGGLGEILANVLLVVEAAWLLALWQA